MNGFKLLTGFTEVILYEFPQQSLGQLFAAAAASTQGFKRRKNVLWIEKEVKDGGEGRRKECCRISDFVPKLAS
jgi:hypothetical protein